MQRAFAQVDVFHADSYGGNPVAVVIGADDLTTFEMQRFARWANLSESTFVMTPAAPGADYRVRIFTPSKELPFAGHPTLGTCHAWLANGGSPDGASEILQECEAGLIRIRRRDAGLAFAAPPLLRGGPVDEPLVLRMAAALKIDRNEIRDAQWVDNGPGWAAVLLDSADAVLALRPGPVDFSLGVVGPHRAGMPEAFEVRAFFANDGGTIEDPVTGSLNASLAGWLIASGRASAPYIARQGTALGRQGRVLIDQDADGTVWVGGATRTCVSGWVEL